MASASSSTAYKPRKRASQIIPKGQELKFQDGLPKSKPSAAVQNALNVFRDRYEYVPLAPDADIRVLILEPGAVTDPIECRLIPTPLPSSTHGSTTREVFRYEALSYYWGTDEDTVPITISYPPRVSLHLYDVVAQATKANKKASLELRHSQKAVADKVRKKFWIRHSLNAALLQLRDPTDKVVLWVDAICINQDDRKEKASQVSRMHQIYSEADNVCIWLGIGEYDIATGVVKPDATERTFKFIREVLNLRRLDKLVRSEDHIKDWLSFVQLMRNRWFSRRWVVQELALATAATVHYGEEVILWKDFADAVALFVKNHDQINALLKKKSIGYSDPIGDMKALGANTLVEATSNLFRRSKDGHIMERLKNLETLVSSLLAFEATDPRDTVYGVLSIAKDTPYSTSATAAQMSASISSLSPSSNSAPQQGDDRIIPNYNKSLGHICSDFIAYCVETSRSLDIICRHWAPLHPPSEEDFTMPSWVSLITGSAFGSPEEALQGRSNADSLVGVGTGQHKKSYNASAGLPALATFTASHRFHARQVQHRADEAGATPSLGGKATQSGAAMPSKTYNNLLTVKGIQLDRIGKLSPRVVGGMIAKECLNMAGWSYGSHLGEVEDALWRTLVADRGPYGINAPCWYKRACLSCLAEVPRNGDLNTGALMANPETPSTMVSFLKRVQNVVWNRKFLRSQGVDSSQDNGVGEEDQSLLGHAPMAAEEGDYICILFGCSVPVILREHIATTDSGQQESWWEFIGEAYIHGMMDGEALSDDVPEHPYDGYQNFRII